MAKRYTLTRVQRIPKPRAEVFAFFSDAQNLEKLAPPFVDFRILTPAPIHVREGAHIEYRIALHGVPMQWETLIDMFVEGEKFSDVQLRGPYRLWHHLHEFRDIPGGTLMHDTVDYEIPLGVLGRVARRLFVARRLEQIFSFRHEVVTRTFGAFPGV